MSVSVRYIRRPTSARVPVPVSGTELEASVLCPDSGLVTVRLVATGTGYLDITTADGIYSGYIMSYSDKAGLNSAV